MMTLWQMPAVVLTLITWLTSPPANLAEISQREALRRSLTPKSAGSYSNDNMRPDLFPVRVTQTEGAATSDIASASSAASTAPATTAAAAPAADATAPNATADEKVWRARIAQARSTMERNQGFLEAMQSRVNSLQNDVVNRDDPAQQGAMRQTLAKALGEIERLKAQIVADQKAISDIQTEARKLNVPPGWVR